MTAEQIKLTGLLEAVNEMLPLLDSRFVNPRPEGAAEKIRADGNAEWNEKLKNLRHAAAVAESK